MTTVSQSLLSALAKQLLRAKTLLQFLFTFWISPSSSSKHDLSSSKIQLPRSGSSPLSAEEFLAEAEALILQPFAEDGILKLSRALKAQFRDRLLTDPTCMLPSYNHQLPSGQESGRYVALDVGGSTLRVAIVALQRQGGKTQEGGRSEIVHMRAFPIRRDVKDLKGSAFFDWMAQRIVEVLETKQGKDIRGDGTLPIALSWSFPIEQTSLRSGRIHDMGKGFGAAHGLQGQELSEVIENACHRAGLDAAVHVILNDSNATLLSSAHAHPSTRFGLILGTGVNIAAYLPVDLVGTAKFGDRPDGWFEEARSVIVNTEVGMFGKDILPITRWDASLKAEHSRPDFQPLEHEVSGMYLGEVARFMLLEAIQTTGVFGGIIPENLGHNYSLSTEMMSIVESDGSSTLEKATQSFSTRHPSPHKPTQSDMRFFRSLAVFISRRSAAITAAALHASWELRLEGIRETAAAAGSSSRNPSAESELALQNTVVSVSGSVVESYPGYRTMCQNFLDGLVAASGGDEGLSIELVPAKESSLIGAGVALAAALHEGS